MDTFAIVPPETVRGITISRQASVAVVVYIIAEGIGFTTTLKFVVKAHNSPEDCVAFNV